MQDWLSNTDPTLVLTALGALVTWLYAKARGKKTENITSVLGSLLKAEVVRIVADPANHAKARACLEKAAWAGLERVGIKRSKGYELIVNVAIEGALAEVEERLALLTMTTRVAAMSDAAAKVGSAFTPPVNPTVPKIDASFFEVEIVK